MAGALSQAHRRHSLAGSAAAFNGPPRTTNGAATPAPDAPLDPATIGVLQGRIRTLPPPQLAAFTQSFRRVFQVPAESPSIAGQITQQGHRLWTQDYLGRLQSQHQQARTA